MIAAALAAVAAFNLSCVGTSFAGTGMDALKKENQSQYTQTFRIDLDSGRWCNGKCDTTSQIYNINQTKIMLKYEKDDSIQTESFILLNREDGSILDRTKIAEFLVMNTGKCERIPFSGFPARKF